MRISSKCRECSIVFETYIMSKPSQIEYCSDECWKKHYTKFQNGSVHMETGLIMPKEVMM